VTAGHRPAIPYANKVDSKEERCDSCSATERRESGVLATVGQGIGDASGSFQLCWLTDKAGEEGRDRVSIVQTWNLFSTGSLEGGATPPARFISNSLPPLSFSVVGTSTVRLPQSQHQGSRYPFDCQRYGFSARRPLSEKVDR
jgi:hypothetical protein